jgi:hypothetical protein
MKGAHVGGEGRKAEIDGGYCVAAGDTYRPAMRGRARAREALRDRLGEPDIAADSAHSELGVPSKGS